MSKNAATEDELGALHAKVAKVMSRAIDQIDRAQDMFDVQMGAFEQLPDEDKVIAPIEPPTLSAPLMSVMTKFLADNNVTCAPADSQGLTGLEQALANKKKRKSVGNIVSMTEYDETA